MNGREARKIKKECKVLAQESMGAAILKVLNVLQEKANRASFCKRFKIGMKYIFKKDVVGLLPEVHNEEV